MSEGAFKKQTKIPLRNTLLKDALAELLKGKYNMDQSCDNRLFINNKRRGNKVLAVKTSSAKCAANMQNVKEAIDKDMPAKREYTAEEKAGLKAAGKLRKGKSVLKSLKKKEKFLIKKIATLDGEAKKKAGKRLKGIQKKILKAEEADEAIKGLGSTPAPSMRLSASTSRRSMGTSPLGSFRATLGRAASLPALTSAPKQEVAARAISGDFVRPASLSAQTIRTVSGLGKPKTVRGSVFRA